MEGKKGEREEEKGFIFLIVDDGLEGFALRWKVRGHLHLEGFKT